MRAARVPSFLLLLMIPAVPACEKRSDAPAPVPNPSASGDPTTPKTRTFDPGQLAVFAPLPSTIERPDNALAPDKVELGKMLWFDTRLSGGQDVSCNSCHDVTKGGADVVARSIGTKKLPTPRNAPTIFNAAAESAQGWDARAALLEELVVPHAAEPSAMGVDEKRLVATVTSIPAYAAALKKSFPDAKGAVTGEMVSMAIGAYARKLLTPGRWDKFLEGDPSALTDDEKAGLGAFMDASCTTCHAGRYVGGTQTQKLGVASPWVPAPTDVGRFGVTRQEVDRFVFKVPTLRNVTKTGPYLHDGSATSLADLTKLMARHQLGKELTDGQARSIVTFLGALDGEPPKDLITRPELPASGPKTPKPN
jgi:cytochrome c peroxidase